MLADCWLTGESKFINFDKNLTRKTTLSSWQMVAEEISFRLGVIPFFGGFT